APQVAFNIPVGEVFEIRDRENKTRRFRAVLNEFVVTDGGSRLNGSLKWNDERDVVIFDADELLPGERNLSAKATLAVEEQSGYTWTRVRFEGKIVEETVATDFKTGPAPDFVPESNVAFSYPAIDQFNFYPREHQEGFIQLFDGQPYLFDPRPGKVRISDVESGRLYEAPIAYHAPTRRITFRLPDALEKSHIYRLDILGIPAQSGSVDENITTTDHELMADASGASATLTTQSIE